MSAEQVEEVEALQSIYGDEVTVLSSTAPITLDLSVSPSADIVHVSAVLHVVMPEAYPASEVPQLTIASSKGLDDKLVTELLASARTAAVEGLGMPSIYAALERCRDWLGEHNEPPGSGSAYDEMLKRQRNEEKVKLGA